MGFYQLGVELLGSESILSENEVITWESRSAMPWD
jgi:ATP phosphoribosyltransferase regulatory subunit HisZ